MTGGRSDDRDEAAWHERTSTLLGASVGAVAAVGIVYFAVSSLMGGSDDPDPAGQYFLEPTATSSRFATPGSGPSTTQTVTSTSPPATTDINFPNSPPPPTSGTDTTSSDDSTSETTRSRSPRRTTEDDDDDATTTRSRPRLNETRTLYPRP